MLVTCVCGVLHSIWGVALADLSTSFLGGGASFFSFSVVGTNRVRSALKLRICGLASMMVALFGALPDEDVAAEPEEEEEAGLPAIPEGAPGRSPGGGGGGIPSNNT